LICNFLGCDAKEGEKMTSKKRGDFGKEAKVGMTVLGILTAGFVSSIYYRVQQSKSPPPQPLAAKSPVKPVQPQHLTAANTPAMTPAERPPVASLPVEPTAVYKPEAFDAPTAFAAQEDMTQPPSQYQTPETGRETRPGKVVHLREMPRTNEQFLTDTSPGTSPNVEPVVNPVGIETRGLEDTVGNIPSGVAPASFVAEDPQPMDSTSLRAQRLITIRDDSFWRLAEQAYGSGLYFKALYAHNRKRFPDADRIPAQAVVEAPPEELLRQLYPDACPSPEQVVASYELEPRRRLYIVQLGDSLHTIARNELGDARRWPEIYRLNQSRLGNRTENLPADMQLLMPGE